MFFRKRNIYLLLAIIFMVVMHFIPVGRAVSLETSKELFLHGFPTIEILAIAITAVSLLSFLLSSKRKVQSALAWLAMIATAVFQFMLILGINEHAEMLDGVQFDGTFSWGTFFPFLAIIAFIIAIRYIHGDAAEARQPIVHE